MYYTVMMSIMVLLCLLAIILKISEWYRYYYSSERYFENLLIQHDKDAEILNTPFSMDELAAQFHQQNQFFVNWNDPVESAKMLKETLRKLTDEYKAAKKERDHWEFEAIQLNDQRKELEEQVDQQAQMLIMNDPDLSYLKYKLEEKERHLNNSLRELERKHERTRRFGMYH